MPTQRNLHANLIFFPEILFDICLNMNILGRRQWYTGRIYSFTFIIISFLHTKLFCSVNAVSRKDAFPLPRIGDCLDCIGGQISLEFWIYKVNIGELKLMKLTDQEQPSQQGLGCTNMSPSIFQQCIELVLWGLQCEILLTYPDDIILHICDFSWKKYLNKLDTVFTRLREAGDKLNLMTYSRRQCHFWVMWCPRKVSSQIWLR